MKSPARGGLTSAPPFLIFNDGCVELSWKWGVPKQYLKWEVVPDQPVEAEKPRLITPVCCQQRNIAHTALQAALFGAA